MTADRRKIELALARACANASDLTPTAAMTHRTIQNVMTGRNVKPATIGRLAKALGVDPAEIIETAPESRQ